MALLPKQKNLNIGNILMAETISQDFSKRLILKKTKYNIQI